MLKGVLKKNFIGVYLIYNFVLISGVQQSESVIHTHIFFLFQILFPYRLLQNIEFPVLYSRSLLVIYFIYSSVCMLIPSSRFIPSHDVSPLVTISLFSISVRLCFAFKFICIIFFRFHIQAISYDVCLCLAYFT